MRTEIVIVQRYFYNFREGFFNYLNSIVPDFKLINSVKSRGRVTVHKNIVSKCSYIYPIKSININDNIVWFPFLFFSLLKLNPNVIVTEGGQNTINNIQIRLYCLLMSRQYIVWDLGKGYQDFGNSLSRRIYMHFYTRLLKKATYVYGYNSCSKEYFLSLGVPKERIFIMNNTIDTIAVKETILKSSHEMPEDLRLIHSNEKIFIIFVGSLLPTKKIEDLVPIMRGLGDKYHLLLIGSGTKEYETQLKSIFFEVNHTFLGYKQIEQLFPYYKVSSFAILPGLGGLSINQAMAFGLPVLCTHADGAEKDIVHNDITGYIYNNIYDVVVYIKNKSNEDWERMGKAAENLLYSEFSIEQEATRFLNGINYLENGSKK